MEQVSDRVEAEGFGFAKSGRGKRRIGGRRPEAFELEGGLPSGL
jgi:hypothetical protein